MQPAVNYRGEIKNRLGTQRNESTLPLTGRCTLHACRMHAENYSDVLPASITVSCTVAVSAAAPLCVVTATIAPVSMSTAFSALYASAVRPSFSFVMMTGSGPPSPQ